MVTSFRETASTTAAAPVDHDVGVGAAASGRAPEGVLRAATTRVRPGLTEITVSGEVDLTSAEAFGSVVRAAMSAQAHGYVVLDMDGLTFLGARGLGVLVAADRDAHRFGVDWALVVHPCAPAVRALRFLPRETSPAVYSTRGAAVRAVTGGRTS